MVDFDGKGGYSSDYDIRIDCGDSIATPEIGVTGTFRIRQDTAFFYDVTGRNTGHGRLTGDSLIVQGEAQRLVYLRRE